MRELGPDWDSYGGRPITESAIAFLKKVLSEDPQVTPTSRGGLALEVSDGELFTIGPDGDFEYE